MYVKDFKYSPKPIDIILKILNCLSALDLKQVLLQLC